MEEYKSFYTKSVLHYTWGQWLAIQNIIFKIEPLKIFTKIIREQVLQKVLVTTL